MNVKKLLINTLMIGAVAVAPMTMSSCSDDGGGNGGPDIGENSAEASTTGDVELDLNADGAPQVTSQGGALAISWVSDSATVNITVPSNGTGNYNLGGDAVVQVTVGASVWSGTEGSVEITTNDDNKVIGTLNDVKLSEQGGDRTATLNGEFNASKSGGSGGSDNQITLTGAAEDTLSFDMASFANTSQPIEHKAVTLGQGSVNLQIVPQDGTGTLEAVKVANIGSGDAPNKRVAVTVQYDGNPWTSTGDGSIEVSTNSDSEVSGSINDVVLKTPSVDQNVTINGSFSATQ